MALIEVSTENALTAEDSTELPGLTIGSLEGEPRRSGFTSATAAIWVYGSPAIFLLGIVGNTLTLLVMCRRKFRKTTTAIYLSVLAILDTAILIFDMGNDWLNFTFNIHLRYISDPLCTATVFGLFYLATFQPWLLVNLTIERLVAVWAPIRARILFTRRRVCLGLVVTAVGSFVLHAHLLWYLRLYELQPGFVMCVFLPVISPSVLQAYNLLDMIVSTFLPFVLMFVLNGFICYILYRSEMVWAVKKSKDGDVASHPSGSTSRATVNETSEDLPVNESQSAAEPIKEGHNLGKPEKLSMKRGGATRKSTSGKGKISAGTRSTTVTLLLVTYTFLLLKAPRSGLLIYQSLHPPKFDNPEEMAFIRMLWSCFDLLLSLNSAINILLYCVSGRKFRQELVKMFTFRKQGIDRKGRSSESSGVQTSQTQV